MPRSAPRSSSRPRKRPPVKVALVVSVYNDTITGPLRDGAIRTFESRTGITAPDGLEIYPAAGAFEVVALSHAAAATGRFIGVVALGCIIKGETTHDLHLATAVTTSLAQISTATGVPVGLGVLTVNSLDQAKARSGGVGTDGHTHGNKGTEAMDALLDTALTIEQIQNAGNRGRNGLALARIIRPRAEAVPDKGRRSAKAALSRK